MYFFHQQIGKIGNGGGCNFLLKLEPLDSFFAIYYESFARVGKYQMHQGLKFYIMLTSYGKNLYIFVHIFILPLKYSLLGYIFFCSAQLYLIFGIFRIIPVFVSKAVNVSWIIRPRRHPWEDINKSLLDFQGIFFKLVVYKG